MDLRQQIFALLFLVFLACEITGKPAPDSKKRKDAEYKGENNLTISCINIDGKWKMEVRGIFLKLSEVVNNLSCQNQSVHFLEIFISRGIIIDKDLIQVGKGMQVVIVAPKWEIVGSRIINLNGSHGEVLKESKAKIRHVSKRNSTLVKDGLNGKPGQPGGPAGSFYGIGKHFFRGKHLQITAHGGDGSAGQDGYDGVHGEKGMTFHFELVRSAGTGILGAPVDDVDEVYTGDDEEYKYIYEVHELDEDPKYLKKINYTKPGVIMMGGSYIYLCHVYGLPGTTGGNGGHGGVGGKGGFKGEIKLIYLNGDGMINSSAQDGKDGKDGIGGKKGIGGSNGDMVEIACFELEVRRNAIRNTRRIFDSRPSEIKQKDGEDGKTGINLLGQKRLKEAHIMYDFSHTINNFKSYSRYYLKDSVENNELLDFITLINNNEDIARNYTTLGLVDEFTDLELQFHELKDYLDLSIHYNSLHKKLRMIESDPELDEENASILSELSVRIETVTDKIAEGDDYNLVPNVHKYGKELEKLNKYLTDLHSVNNMRQNFKNYKRKIDIELENTQEKMETVVETEIENLMDELDAQVDQLVNEISELEKKAEENKKKLEERRENLQNVMKQRILCGILKFITGGLTKMHPLAGAGAAVVDGLISTYEDGLDDNVVMASVIPKAIIKSLEKTDAQLKLNKEAGTQRMERHLEDIKQQMKSLDSKNKEALKEVEQAVEIAIAVASSSSSETEKSFEEIEIEKLDEAQKTLESKGLKRNKIYEKTFDYIKNLKQTISLTEVFGEYQAKYVKDNSNLDEVEKLIDVENKGIKRLKQLNDNIYTKMVPMVNNMRESIGVSKEDLGSKSIVDLNIVKWQLDTKLSKLLKDIDDFTKEFPVAKEFDFIIKELKKSIDLLIENYMNMKKYSEKNDQAKLIFSLIKDTKESGLNIISSSDNTLRVALSKMEEAHQLNFAIAKYNRLMIAFQQDTFPKSTTVLKTMSKISYSSMRSNLESVEHSIIADVMKIMESVGTSSGHKFLAEKFEVDFDWGNSSRPFHVWENRKYRNEIEHLLMGNQITLFANISEHADLNGVRFNRIEIKFSSKNPDLQHELDNALEQFSFKMIHEGDSHYRCDESIFLAKNNPTKMIYGLRKDSQQSITSFTKKIWEGEFLLSPYATWKMQIMKLGNTAPMINTLKKFRDQVDLELVGKGVHTDIEEKDACKDSKRFYGKKDNNKKKRLMMLL